MKRWKFKKGKTEYWVDYDDGARRVRETIAKSEHIKKPYPYADRAFTCKEYYDDYLETTEAHYKRLGYAMTKCRKEVEA